MWDGRNVKTRLGAIGASSPVLGLRPTRAVLSLRLNVPNEEIFTVSPDTKVSDRCVSTRSTKSEDSLRDRPTSRTTASLKSILVSVFDAIIFLPKLNKFILKEILKNGQQKLIIFYTYQRITAVPQANPPPIAPTMTT
jgi:hypothetical protein